MMMMFYDEEDDDDDDAIRYQKGYEPYTILKQALY